VSSAILYGVKPVVIAIIVQALWRLGHSAVKNRVLAVVGIAAAIASAMRVNELIVLFGAAGLVAAIRAIRQRRTMPAATLPVFAFPLASLTATSTAVGLLPMFLIFLKIGSVLFGSGYVLLAFLRADFVQRLHWLTEAQLLDATAVGQVTPGPVFTTATFIGYVLAGPKGAIVATVGIFLPAFVFVALSAPLIPKLRRSPITAALLDGLNIGSLALMAVVTCQLARDAIHDIPSAAIAIVSAILLLTLRLNATWLVLGGGIVGIFISWLAR
jgi:chromate transporter